MAIPEHEFIIEILRLTIEHDCTNDLIWYKKEGKIICAVNCSDCFWWGTCDYEDLTPESFPVYKQTLEECEVT